MLCFDILLVVKDRYASPYDTGRYEVIGCYAKDADRAKASCWSRVAQYRKRRPELDVKFKAVGRAGSYDTFIGRSVGSFIAEAFKKKTN